MNYQPVTTGNQSNPSAGFQEEIDTKKAGEEATQQYMLFLVWSTGSSNLQNKEGDATFGGKEHDAEKPESAVNLSLSSSARIKASDKSLKDGTSLILSVQEKHPSESTIIISDNKAISFLI
uniref:Uncharacterized protein n=1 Tax=Tanacetum cinerariifolium TaxID=118510 RepID=A0A6L2LYB2_TANCI|nr:hypothetical protein [Tanacetum cinerariifolium]